MNDFSIGVIVVSLSALTWGLLKVCDWLLSDSRRKL